MNVIMSTGPPVLETFQGNIHRRGGGWGGGGGEGGREGGERERVVVGGEG